MPHPNIMNTQSENPPHFGQCCQPPAGHSPQLLLSLNLTHPLMPKLKAVVGPRRHTHPLIWCAAIICTVLAIVVIIAGIVVFVGYLIFHPKVPFISVTTASLDKLFYDQTGLLTAQITVVLRAENQNSKAHASFYDAEFILSFHGLEIAKLVADPFEVKKNSSLDFHYVVESTPIPLDQQGMDFVDSALKEDKIVFDLRGHVRTRWRVGFLGSVKFWLHLSCELQFHPTNKAYISKYCSSKSK